MPLDASRQAQLIENLLIEISSRGEAKPSRVAAERLAGAAGVWRLWPEIGQVMLLERLVDNRAEPEASGRAVRLSGTFDDISVLASILELIHAAKWDGAFHVLSGEVHRVLYLRRGVLLAARSSDPNDRLGWVMVRHGMITEQQCRDCAAELGDSTRFGSILVAKGLLTNAGVYEGLRLQTAGIVGALLALERGSFYLVQPLNMTEVPAMLRLDIQQLMMDGMRQLDELRERLARTPAAADDELRRRQPVTTSGLPPDGAQRIVDTYNNALRTLFRAVSAEARAALLEDLREYLSDNAEDPLLRDVDVDADGSLGVQILANMAQLPAGDPAAHLQLSLNELLFFMMFVASDTLPAGVEQKLQQEVARALQALPGGRTA